MQAPSLRYERRSGYPDRRIAGVDEVGRGCLAGPVVTAAVILPSILGTHPFVSAIRDSKLLSPKKRFELALWIRTWATWSLGRAEVHEIDELNILHATMLAMKRALVGVHADYVLIDGNRLPDGVVGHALVKGDNLSLSIAAASILAKVARDQEMVDLDKYFPNYGFAQHKGYPTKIHQEALERWGISPHHRMSFAPVKKSFLLRGRDHHTGRNAGRGQKL